MLDGKGSFIQLVIINQQMPEATQHVNSFCSLSCMAKTQQNRTNLNSSQTYHESGFNASSICLSQWNWELHHLWLLQECYIVYMSLLSHSFNINVLVNPVTLKCVPTAFSSHSLPLWQLIHPIWMSCCEWNTYCCQSNWVAQYLILILCMHSAILQKPSLQTTFSENPHS